MANIIDTLIVELALDPTKFTQGQQAAIAAARQMTAQVLQQSKETEAAAARVAHYFESVKRAALGALGLFLGGRAVKEFVEETVKSEAAMARSARTIGISTEQLAKWGAMARATGGDAQAITGSLQGLADRIASAQITGDWGNMLQIFGRFGIVLKQTKDGLVDIDDLFDQLNRTFSKMDPVSARAILSMLGLDPSSINLIITQRQEFVRLREEAEKVAKGMDADAKTARELQTAWSELTDTADRLATRAFNALARWLGLADALKKVKELLSTWLVSPSSKEGEEVVQKDVDELHRRFGPSPWGTTGPQPPSAPSAPGPRAPSVPSVPLAPTSFAPMRPYPKNPLDPNDPDYDPVLDPHNPRYNPDDPRLVFGGAQLQRILATGAPGGPNIGGGTTDNSTTSSTTNIGTVNVNISGADNPEETGRSVYRWFQRFNHGASTYNGPH